MNRLTLLLPLLLAGCVVYDDYRVVPARQPVSATRVVSMKQSGVADETIVELIRSNGINREQNADDIVRMKNAGAGDQVIMAMIQGTVTPVQQERVVYSRTEYYDPVFVDNAVYFGLGALFGSWWSRPYHYRCR